LFALTFIVLGGPPLRYLAHENIHQNDSNHGARRLPRARRQRHGGATWQGYDQRQEGIHFCINNAHRPRDRGRKDERSCMGQYEYQVYHSEGQYYGTTKKGKFMTKDDAEKAGYRAAKEPGASKKTTADSKKK
jgi:hypothetical protein